MQMAVVPDDGQHSIPILHSDQGQVAHSTPVLRGKGSERDFAPSVSGNDYIVASWGSGAFYTYHLAEKVWMALGLTPRCLGNEQQRLVYDDLELPEFGVAEGEIQLNTTLRRLGTSNGSCPMSTCASTCGYEADAVSATSTTRRCFWTDQSYALG